MTGSRRRSPPSRPDAASGSPPSARVLVEAYEFAALTGRPLAVDPVTSGAVALDRSLRAPLAIRAVVKNRTLRATDADWEFGTGPGARRDGGGAGAVPVRARGRAGGRV